MNKQSGFLLFLIGLFSLVRVRIVGMIGIAELPCVLLAPILFMQHYSALRRAGFLPMCWLWLLTIGGCILSSVYNGTQFSFILRGIATPVVVFSSIVVIYTLTRRNPDGIRWLILGWSLSGVCTFVLHGGSVAALLSDNPDAGGALGTSILRMYLFAPIVLIPVRCWYTKTPVLIAVGTLCAYGVYIAASSVSGRSAALGILGGAALIFIGRKSIKAMSRIRKLFVFYFVLLLVCVFALKSIYSHAALSGVMGEAIRNKYERQTRGNNSMLNILMGGRMEFFIGVFAALERPLIGYGPWAVDRYGLYSRFLEKYGNSERADEYFKEQAKNGGRMAWLPAHSHIIGFWTWYGIIGLILWLYILKLLFKFFTKYIDVVPQWYGMLATLMPPLLWDIFFSPLYHRVEVAALICALLYVRAIANGRIHMPYAMELERQKYL